MRPLVYLYDPDHKSKAKQQQGWQEIAKEIYPKCDSFTKRQKHNKSKYYEFICDKTVCILLIDSAK